MEKNTWLNIYQAYSLEKISALNKHGLAMQYAQCEQLVKLNKELAATNATTRRILQNQIREIEKREEQKYYKSLAFNINLALQEIENQENIHFKTFLCNIFLTGLKSLAKQAVGSLEEISDKEYVQTIIKKIQNIEQTVKTNKELYNNSIWAKYVPENEKYLKETEQYEKEIAIKESEIKQIEETYAKEINKHEQEKKGCAGCLKVITGFLAVFIIAFIGTIFTKDYEATLGSVYMIAICAVLYVIVKWSIKNSSKKANIVQKDNDRLLTLQDEISQISTKNVELNREHNNILQSMNLECPTWERDIQKITLLLPSEK